MNDESPKPPTPPETPAETPSEAPKVSEAPKPPMAITIPTPTPKKRITTVANLIRVLQAMPQDAVVSLAGCDCYGYASGEVELHDQDAVQLFGSTEEFGVPNAGVKVVTIERAEDDA